MVPRYIFFLDVFNFFERLSRHEVFVCVGFRIDVDQTPLSCLYCRDSTVVSFECDVFCHEGGSLVQCFFELLVLQLVGMFRYTFVCHLRFFETVIANCCIRFRCQAKVI